MLKSKILNPPLWVACIVFILSIGLIIASLTLVILENYFVGYFVYPLAAIVFGYSVYLVVIYFKPAKLFIKNALLKHELTNNLVTDYSFRTITISLVTLAINNAFILFNLILGIIVKSPFYIIMAVYYFFLSLVKYGIYSGNKKSCKKDLEYEKSKIVNKTYLSTGIKLILMEVVFATSVVVSIFSGKKINYEIIIAIAFATFTFSKLAFAIYNVIKARKINNPITQAFRNVSLIDALATLMSLQVTLIVVSSENSFEEIIPMNIITGSIIFVLGVSIGIRMIIVGNKLLEKKEKLNLEKWWKL